DLGDTLLFVVSDRLSAFDVILPDPIPFKGAVLNQISAFWFKRFQKIENHFVTADFDEFPNNLKKFRDQLAGRSMIVRKTTPLTVECVVRGIWPGRVGKNIGNRKVSAESNCRRTCSWPRRYRWPSSRLQPRPNRAT